MPRPLALGVLLVVTAATAGAQPRSSADVVSWTAEAVQTPRGARLVVTGQIGPGWRIYAPGSALGRPLELTLPTDDGVRAAGPVRTSRPSCSRDASTGTSYLYFAGPVRLEVPLALVSPRAAQGRRIQGTLSFTACNDSVCLRPSTVPITADVQVE